MPFFLQVKGKYICAFMRSEPRPPLRYLKAHGSLPGWPNGSGFFFADEEKQKHYVHSKSQLSGLGHSEIGLVETLMLSLTWLGLETAPAGTPENRTVKSHWAVRQESRPARVQPEKKEKKRPALASGFGFSGEDVEAKRGGFSRKVSIKGCIS